MQNEKTASFHFSTFSIQKVFLVAQKMQKRNLTKTSELLAWKSKKIREIGKIRTRNQNKQTNKKNNNLSYWLGKGVSADRRWIKFRANKQKI